MGFFIGLLLSYLAIPENLKNRHSVVFGPQIIDISNLKEGSIDFYMWDNIPIGVYRRTEKEISYLLKFRTEVRDKMSEKQIQKKWLGDTFDRISNNSINSVWMKSKTRSIKEDVFVFIMKSPIRGCTVIKSIYQRSSRRGMPMSGFKNYFIDTCTHQGFDLAGRIFINHYYNTHLLIPNHRYIDENTIELVPNE